MLKKKKGYIYTRVSTAIQVGEYSQGYRISLNYYGFAPPFLINKYILQLLEKENTIKQ